MISEHFYQDQATLTAALADDTASALRNAIEARGEASLIVSGGSSPGPLYQTLADTPLEWARVHVALADERWVGPEHEKSNQRMLSQTLLQKQASAARFVPMKTAHATALEGEASCEAAYGDLPQPFDWIILGMGPDAHTASLFPKADGLEAALDVTSRRLCKAITAIPSDTTSGLCERMSMTLSGLLNARRIVLLITGEDKRRVYEECRQQGGSAEAQPIRAILEQEQVPVSVYWAP